MVLDDVAVYTHAQNNKKPETIKRADVSTNAKLNRRTNERACCLHHGIPSGISEDRPHCKTNTEV